MKGLKNLCASWHVERNSMYKRHLYAKVSQMEGWNVTGLLKMEVLWLGKLNIFCKAFDDSQYQQIDRSVKRGTRFPSQFETICHSSTHRSLRCSCRR